MSFISALMPTRRAFDRGANAGAAYLMAAGIEVELLPNFSSVFEAYEHGVARLAAADDDIVLLVHSGVVRQNRRQVRAFI